MKFFIYSLFTLILINESCMSTRGMRVQVARPAEITVIPDIKSVTIVNRSIPSEGRTVENVLTAERKNQDKELSEQCIQGLNELLNESTRF